MDQHKADGEIKRLMNDEVLFEAEVAKVRILLGSQPIYEVIAFLEKLTSYTHSVASTLYVNLQDVIPIDIFNNVFLPYV